jgi:hypothetical protein
MRPTTPKGSRPECTNRCAEVLTLFLPCQNTGTYHVSTAMLERGIRKLACLAALAALATPLAFPQEASSLKPPPYRGVTVFVDGIFVTPVPGVPLTAVVEIQSTQVLSDGSTDVRKSFANIARDSQGRIYNERRQLVGPSFTETPRILGFHIYDPETKLNTFLDPSTHLARQSIFRGRGPEPANDPLATDQDLGTEIMEGVSVHGTRRSGTLPAATSGTGNAVVVTDEYWYSEDLHLNMLEKRNDPRTAQQTVTVTKVDRSEPNPAMLEVPADYKVVDENPAN